MEEQSTTRRVHIAMVEGKRQWQAETRMGGWCDGRFQKVERNLRNAARNRESWQKLLKKALAQKGLLC